MHVIIFILLSFFQPVNDPPEVVSFEQLEAYIDNYNNQKLLVVNFWATWCAPCVKELPYFEEAGRKNEVDVLLVSIDFEEDALDKVTRFQERKQLESPVMIMENLNFNEWMPKISEEWSGAIPATLIVRTDTNQRWFYEQAFEQEELQKLIDKHLN